MEYLQKYNIKMVIEMVFLEQQQQQQQKQQPQQPKYLQSGQDAEDLLSNDWQHFDVDAVEFIKAAPKAGLRVTGKQFPHRLVIEAVRAVDDDDENGHGFAQIFRCLRLAGTSGTFRRSTSVPRIILMLEEDWV